MKRMDLFCASSASTAICSSQDHRATVRHGTRSVNRQNSKSNYIPCSSHLLINPNTYYEKSRKSTTTSKQSDDHVHRRLSADSQEMSSVKRNDIRRKSSADISDLRSPPGSARYLLSDRPYIDCISESDGHVSALVSPIDQQAKPKHTSSKNVDSSARRSSSSLAPSRDWISEFDSKVKAKPGHLISSNNSPSLKTSSSARFHDQVVVLWVSIHCKGCEGKVRKHISKMEGVSSFSIDLATKKVTVIGNVTPLGVLASVSKVKNAQLWPSSSSSPSPSPRWSTS